MEKDYGNWTDEDKKWKSIAEAGNMGPSSIKEKHPTCSTCYWCDILDDCRRLKKVIYHPEIFYCADHEAKGEVRGEL